MEINQEGVPIWQKLLGGSSGEFGNDIISSYDGGVLFVGSTASSNTGTFLGLENNGANDSLLLKLDENGNPY